MVRLSTVLLIGMLVGGGCSESPPSSEGPPDASASLGGASSTPALSEASGAAEAAEAGASHPYSGLTTAGAEQVLEVMEGSVFIAVLGLLMADYEPALAAVNDPELLRCITDEAFHFDAELGKLDQKLASELQAAEAERAAQEREFYTNVYPVQFRIDLDFAARPGRTRKQTYGCWDRSGEYWETGHRSRRACLDAYSEHRWRLRSSRWEEDPAINLYSRTETPQPPELMRRAEAAGVAAPERISCLVGQVVHPKDQDHAVLTCLAPRDSSVVPAWLSEAGRLDPTPEGAASASLYSEEALSAALGALLGAPSSVSPDLAALFALQVQAPEATGVRIGDVVSLPVAGVQGVDPGVVSAEFETNGGQPPRLRRWVVQGRAGTLRVESSEGTCPSEEDLAAQLCGVFTRHSDRERALETCVLGGQLDPLFRLAEQWRRMRFDGKEAFLADVDAALAGHEPPSSLAGSGVAAAADRPTSQPVDKEVVENAGVLGSLADSIELDGVFGSSNPSSDLAGGLGGLIGAKGTQIGSGGLGSRGSGLGGGGSAEGLGGLGTKGRGSGRSGYGSGGSTSGAKGSGGAARVGGDPVIIGSLDKGLIHAVVKRHMNQIRYCYQRELTKNPTLGGTVTIKVVIAKDGSVSKASVKSSTMGSSAVTNCIVSRFQQFTFPEPKGGGIVIVSYPFVFSPG